VGARDDATPRLGGERRFYMARFMVGPGWRARAPALRGTRGGSLTTVRVLGLEGRR
jgi:hypothetical protein